MKSYDKVPVKVQKKSGFDKSFQNLFTSKVGTITPILVDELIPNSTVHLKAAITAALPPLASDTFMRCKLKYAAFFVPSRLLMKGYEKWLTNNNGDDAHKVRIPQMLFPVDVLNGSSSNDRETRLKYLGPGSLADYLGFKAINSELIANTQPGESGYQKDIQLNALPFLAYHRIYNDWFRNSLVQKDIYDEETMAVVYTPFSSLNVVPTTTNKYTIICDPSDPEEMFADGVSPWDLRQANFGYDIYTTASPQAQNGKAQAVTMATIDGQDGFTISALRAANSMQQFLERNNLAGNRLVDFVKAQYGANLSDSIAQRPILLGKGDFDVYSKGIYQTNPNNVDATYDSNNPFTSVGARYGSAYADGSDTLVDNFTAMEPGYLMVLAWLSPKVTYSTGVDPILTRYDTNSTSDMANPILQNVGNEPIFTSQLSMYPLYQGIHSSGDKVFGYIERYGNWKDKQDEVHGILRDTSSLQSFALQRSFRRDVQPKITSDFLKIPTSYLDQVAAVSSDISTYGYWADTYFNYKVSMPLAEYSVPSLQDPAYEHGVDVTIDKNGKSLS